MGDKEIMKRSSLGIILGALCLVAAIAGIACLIVAHGMPAHVDERRAGQLTGLYEHDYSSKTDEQRKPIEQEMASLRTSKWKLYHAGLVLSLVSTVLLYAWYRFKLWDLRNLKHAETPCTRLSLLALASGAWLTLVPAISWRFSMILPKTISLRRSIPGTESFGSLDHYFFF
jgi:hypothetical protein